MRASDNEQGNNKLWPSGNPPWWVFSCEFFKSLKKIFYIKKAGISWDYLFSENIKGTVTQIEKKLINDRLGVSNISLKFLITTTYYFAVIYSCNLRFS